MGTLEACRRAASSGYVIRGKSGESELMCRATSVVARRISRDASTIQEDLYEDDIIQRATAQLGFDLPVP